MSIFLALKLIAVGFMLVMFIRRPSLVWAVGLLTVTTAVLLDAFLGTFGREELAGELGFFYPAINGALFGGAAVWIWGVLQRVIREGLAAPAPAAQPKAVNPKPAATASPAEADTAAFDRQMLTDAIRTRLGRADVLDLMFDLAIHENEVLIPGQTTSEFITALLDTAEQRGQTPALALAVERILTPPPPEHLPRREKLTADSPPPYCANICWPISTSTRCNNWRLTWTWIGKIWAATAKRRRRAACCNTSTAAIASTT
jgi:hypothetical protein